MNLWSKRNSEITNALSNKELQEYNEEILISGDVSNQRKLRDRKDKALAVPLQKLIALN